jgi:hypothetical protein
MAGVQSAGCKQAGGGLGKATAPQAQFGAPSSTADRYALGTELEAASASGERGLTEL